MGPAEMAVGLWPDGSSFNQCSAALALSKGQREEFLQYASSASYRIDDLAN
jgi:hypothetical protein